MCPAPLPADAQDFDVRFNAPGMASPSGNPFRLHGPGKLRLRADSLELIGQVRHLFRSRPAPPLRFPLARIVNVQLAGAAVAFDIVIEVRGAQSLARVVAWLTSEDAARELASRLPATQTATFRKTSQEVADFTQRLRAVSPHAPVTRFLMGTNVLVFVAMVVSGAGLLEPNADVHIQWGSNFGPLTLHGQYWRLLTSTFIHFGALHLAFNMWALYLYGDMTERLLGSTRFALLYVFAGIAGSVASVWWNPLVNSAGASGAVFGVLGGLFAFLTLRSTGVPMSIVVAHRNSLLVILGLNLFFGFVHPLIDNAAHLGGLAAGFLAGLALARPVDPGHRSEPAPGRVIAFAVLAAAALMAIFLAGSERLGAHTQLRMNLQWLGHYEASVADTYADLKKSAAAGKIGKDELVRGIERDVLPFWNDAAKRFAAEPADVSEDIRAFRGTVRDYVLARHEAIAAHAAGLRDNNRAVLGESRAAWIRSENALERLNAMELPQQLRED